MKLMFQSKENRIDWVDGDRQIQLYKNKKQKNKTKKNPLRNQENFHSKMLKIIWFQEVQWEKSYSSLCLWLIDRVMANFLILHLTS